MISKETRLLIKYRVEQAEEALDDAASLLGRGSFRGALNRAYYAMFYAVLALMNLLGKGASKHGAAIAVFDREFVKTGAFDKEFSQALHEAFLQRQKADYDELIEVSREDAASMLEHAHRFVERAKCHLVERLGGPND